MFQRLLQDASSPEPDPIKAQARRQRWLDKHPGYLKDYQRQYGKRPDRKAKRNDWLKKTGKGVAYVHHRRDQMRGVWTPEEWAAVCEQYGNVCLACGKPEVTVDHVVPISLGGSNTIENLQPLCRSCNCRKQNKVVDYR